MSEMTISGEFRAACEREFTEIRVKLDRLDVRSGATASPASRCGWTDWNRMRSDSPDSFG